VSVEPGATLAAWRNKGGEGAMMELWRPYNRKGIALIVYGPEGGQVLTYFRTEPAALAFVKWMADSI